MYLLIVSLISVLIGCEAAKILGVFPTPSISHQVVFRPLMLELAKRGHEVTVITTDPAYPQGHAPQNLTEIDIHDMSYEIWNKFLIDKGHEEETILYHKLVMNLFTELFERQLTTVEVQKLLHDDKKFDLVIVESHVQPALIFSHIYNAPIIEFSSMGGLFLAFERVGAATHPFFYPISLRRKIHNLTFLEKISEFYTYYTIDRNLREHVHTDNEMLKKVFGPNIPGLDELRSKIMMLFLNVHPMWDLNRPVPPSVLYLGGLHQKPQQELPKDIQSYLDSSKHGVIYMSFGTNVKPQSFPPDKLKIFTKTFSQLPYDVLWKWDNDELPGRPKNVRISKWLPQSDLLRHPKVKLFITQAGLQSTDEALTAGVPLIGIPMLGDQWFNTEQYVKFNIGKQLPMETVTEENLKDAIVNVINDESYRQNIVKLRNILTDQPQSPLERAVWWTEHVLRHGGGAHLRAPAAYMSWTDYYELELVLTLLVALVLSLISTVFLATKLIKYSSIRTNNVRKQLNRMLSFRKMVKVN